MSSDTLFLIGRSHLPNGRLALFKNLLKIEILCLEFYCSNPSRNNKWYIFHPLGPIPNLEIPHIPKVLLTISFSSQPDRLLYKPSYLHIHSRLNAILKLKSEEETHRHSSSGYNMDR